LGNLPIYTAKCDPSDRNESRVGNFIIMIIIRGLKDHTFGFKMTPKAWLYLSFLTKL